MPLKSEILAVKDKVLSEIAFELWVYDGKPIGNDKLHWNMAESLFNSAIRRNWP